MRFLTAGLMVMALLSLPVMAQDGTPPADPPMTDPPPDDPPVKPPSEEELRLKMVEKDAKEKADMLRKRMDAAKTDQERGTAISDCASGGNAVPHPILAAALIPYLNPRPIKAGLTYGDSTINAAIEALKHQPFDETYTGVKKMIDQNRMNFAYVIRLIAIFGEIKCKKAVNPLLIEMARDKRDGRITLCKAAIEQIGKIGWRDGVEPLISELEEQDKAGPSDAKAKDRRAQLNGTVCEALKRITSQEFKLGSQYRQWWHENSETFQREKKPAPPDGGGDDK